MSVQVYGCNHVAIEVDDVEKAVAFYKDVFNLEQMSGGEGDAFFKLGDHQFLAIFELDNVSEQICGISDMVRDERSLRKSEETDRKYKLKLEPPFRCDFRDPWGNRFRWSIFTMNRSSGSCLTGKFKRPASISKGND